MSRLSFCVLSKRVRTPWLKALTPLPLIRAAICKTGYPVRPVSSPLGRTSEFGLLKTAKEKPPGILQAVQFSEISADAAEPLAHNLAGIGNQHESLGIH